jgi:hypothetical protein
MRVSIFFLFIPFILTSQSITIDARVEFMFVSNANIAKDLYWEYSQKAFLDDERSYDILPCNEVFGPFSVLCYDLLDTFKNHQRGKVKCIDRTVAYSNIFKESAVMYKNNKHTYSTIKTDTIMISFRVKGRAFVLSKEFCPGFDHYERSSPVDQPQKKFPVLLLNGISKIKRLRKTERKYPKFKKRYFIKASD